MQKTFWKGFGWKFPCKNQKCFGKLPLKNFHENKTKNFVEKIQLKHFHENHFKNLFGKDSVETFP
jgi:hypothetical protein